MGILLVIYLLTEKKYLADKRSKKKGPRLSSPLILQMREKLKSYLGKRVYSFRFPVAEGAIAVLKEIPQGSKFLRRGLNRVQTEWTESLLKKQALVQHADVLPFCRFARHFRKTNNERDFKLRLKIASVEKPPFNRCGFSTLPQSAV